MNCGLKFGKLIYTVTILLYSVRPEYKKLLLFSSCVKLVLFKNLVLYKMLQPLSHMN